MNRQSVRSHFVRRVENMLRRADQPRFQMSVIVLVTGAAGFLCSYVFLLTGIESLALRYPLAVAVAYLVFLGLLRLWLAYQQRRLAVSPDFLDVADPIVFGGSGEETVSFTGGGGRFGGGGATDSFADAPSHLSTSDTSSEALASVSDGASFDIDPGEFVLILVAILFLLGVAAASIYVVYIAPGLFAEILVDGVLIAGLYRRLRGGNPQHWLATAVGNTYLPFLGLALSLAIGGYIIQWIAPEANSIGDLFR